MKQLLRGMQKVIEALSRRHERYNETTAYTCEQEKAGKALVIRPPVKLEVGHVEHDPEKLQAAYDLGRAEGKKRMEEIRAFVGA